ncbi:uncharacterized protein LOC130695933 isoform X1 [Daphnia carinata]|uniref:uncharacterized protein LOC130695933 isoform X1 n=1 Tax=Daphnia carinata TaxID=120202 RepID=UPI0028685DD6|nr:uncharacterized protein LOC130695933 isoform X1 [Daphnia carinata]
MIVVTPLSSWTLAILMCWTCNGHGLVMRGLEGPTQSVTRGTDIILHCRYDLEDGDRLYAVKWFHGTREFYRFQPELQPPARSFPIEHVYVDVESSNAEKLVIRHVVPGTSGIYRCEVSAEETFETDYREMNITIEDAPTADPVIYNIQSRYAIDDELRINCTSFHYGPASRLHWIINGQMKSDDDDEVTLYPTRWRTPLAAADSQFVSGATPEASTTIGLHIKRLTGQHFGSGNQLTVVCTASSIGSAHRRSSAVKAVLDEGLSSRQGPLVNPLRPSTVSTAAGDKRRSAQHPTGGCSGLASNLVAIILTTIQLALFR